MDGFKNSTKTQYSMGGYAKGGSKFGKVMGEFKAGTLHSGSKKGAEVTNPKQAVAIALSEARKAGMKKAQGGTVKMTDAEKRMVAIEKNEHTQAPKPATPKPATTSGNKPMTDAEKRMVDIEKNETGGYKKGGSAQRKPSVKTADALRAQKYKAAMASRPNREPRIPVKDPAKMQMAAGAIKSAIEKAISTRAAQQPAPQAAPPMEAAAPPMMGAPPAMKKGGKVAKRQDGGMATSIRPTKDYNASDKDFVGARAEQLKGIVGNAEGGKADLKQDKAMIKAMIHKHERNDHPGKPLTKLRKGGMPC
jgi:hypothetical protein